MKKNLKEQPKWAMTVNALILNLTNQNLTLNVRRFILNGIVLNKNLGGIVRKNRLQIVLLRMLFKNGLMLKMP